jgi:Flp pilus assembly protein TadG
MRRLHGRWRVFGRQERGAAVIEFALVVPIFFLLVWGGLNFSRAYQRLNVLTGALREGARYGATLTTMAGVADSVNARVASYSSAFGFEIDTTQVVTSYGLDQLQVSVVNYPLFANLTGFGILSTITVDRSAIFRCERPTACP